MSTEGLPHTAPATNPTWGPRTISFNRGDHPTAGNHVDWMQCAERLSDADCDEIITACRAFPLSPPETVGQERYPSHRQADTRKIAFDATTSWVFQLLCTVAAEASHVAYELELTTINRPPQYVEYRPGWGRFDWHNDYSHGVIEAPRKVTIIIQLSRSDEYEGGRLQMTGVTVEDLPDARGTIIAFPSFLYHRVTPVTSGMRRALVAWIAGPRLR